MAWHDVAALLRESPVIAVRDHRALRGSLREAERAGRLARVLPGVYADSARAGEVAALAAAATACDPDAVVIGRAALSLLVQPCTLRHVEASCRRQHVGSARVRFRRIAVHPSWVVEDAGLRIQHPAAAAVMLAASDGGEAIDLVLRRRAATLHQLNTALAVHPARPGNPGRAAVVLASRDEPWSRAERVLHQLLRDAGVDGWRSNYPIQVDGRRFYADVAFPTVRWIVEVDGLAAHATAGALVSDLRRQNLLTLAGWNLLRFTWADLVDRPQTVLAQIRAVVGQPACA